SFFVKIVIHIVLVTGGCGFGPGFSSLVFGVEKFKQKLFPEYISTLWLPVGQTDSIQTIRNIRKVIQPSYFIKILAIDSHGYILKIMLYPEINSTPVIADFT